MRAARSCSLCACTDRRRLPAGTSTADSNARVRRVSSHAITSASRSACSGAGEVAEVADGRPDQTSDRPHGSLRCAASIAHPRSTRSASAGSTALRRSLSDLDDVAFAQRPSIERARPRPRSRTGPGARAGRAATGAANSTRTTAPSAVAERDVDREAHADRVDVTTRSQHERALDAVAAEQPASPLATGARHLGCRQHVIRSYEPGHREPPQTGSHVEADLEHVAVGDLVVLPLDPELAEILGLRPRPDLEELLASR